MRKRIMKRILATVLILGLLGGSAVAGINFWVCGSTTGRILSPEKAAALTDIDCVLVLGCQVKENGSPSHMLEDRLKRGVSLYEGGIPKLLMSGDHGQAHYNEVGTMKQYAVDAGVPSSDVFMDHAGFSTYESLYRAKAVFGVDRVIIVTQKYHLYRALFIARALGIEAWGVASDYRTYSGQSIREVREVLARVKDVGSSLLKLKPTYLGEPISITGDGNMTND